MELRRWAHVNSILTRGDYYLFSFECEPVIGIVFMYLFQLILKIGLELGELDDNISIGPVMFGAVLYLVQGRAGYRWLSSVI